VLLVQELTTIMMKEKMLQRKRLSIVNNKNSKQHLKPLSLRPPTPFHHKPSSKQLTKPHLLLLLTLFQHIMNSKLCMRLP